MSTRTVNPPLLEVDNVVANLGSRRVLDGATLLAAPGTVTCLTGGNGAGKTTLLRVAAGIVTPRSGDVRLGGRSYRDGPRAYLRRLGVLPAGDRGLYARLTVLEQLDHWAALALVADRAGGARRAIARFGLEELADRRVDRLSLGQRQRVRLAVATVHDPDVLLLDEPHSSLDDDGLAILGDALRELAARGGATVWAAPARAHAALPVDVHCMVADGQVVQQ